MDINEMTLEQIEERKLEIKGLLDQEGCDVDALADEVKALEERRATLMAEIEERKAKMNEVLAGAGKIIEKMEERTMEKTYAANTPEYRAAWLKNLQGNTLDAEERTAMTAGAAIPTETLNKIIDKAELYPLFNAVDVLHIPGSVSIPKATTVNNGAVVAMGTAATDSDDVLGTVTLTTYKIIKTLEITADVAAMSVDAFESWLVDRLANKMYRTVTKLIAAGTGSSQPTGLVSIDATGHTYTKTAITYADVLAIIASLPTEFLPNASFVMSRATFWSNVMNIQDTANHPIVVADLQAPAKYNVLGFPVILEDEIGTSIVFGDLKEGYVWNFGKEISVDRDESVGFRTGSTVFRGMCLGDGKPTGVGLVRYTKAA